MSKQNPTIMVVEDEVLLLQAITKKLKLSNLDVISCASGQQAIDYLNNLDELPDAVWLDYYLKDMNGLGFMQTLKQNPKWTNIPVMVVSNSASPEKVHNMLGLGAKKYILKAEYRLDEIIDMIRDFIKDGAGDATDVTPLPPAPSAVTASTPPPAAATMASGAPSSMSTPSAAAMSSTDTPEHATESEKPQQ
jgi:CheY-like chemotaxis protein